MKKSNLILNWHHPVYKNINPEELYKATPKIWSLFRERLGRRERSRFFSCLQACFTTALSPSPLAYSRPAKVKIYLILNYAVYTYTLVQPKGTEDNFKYLNSIFLLQHKARQTRLTHCTSLVHLKRKPNFFFPQS